MLSQGAVWPQPQKMSCGDTPLLIASQALFKFSTKNVSSSCDIVTKAIQRFLKSISPKRNIKKVACGPIEKRPKIYENAGTLASSISPIFRHFIIKMLIYLQCWLWVPWKSPYMDPVKVGPILAWMSLVSN